MEIKPIEQIKTKDDARQEAITFQNWANEQNLSYGELIQYHQYFITLSKRFNLVREFKENGII